jgi:hypothetical protein
VVGDTVLLDQRDDVRWREGRERRAAEVRVAGEVVFRRGVEVGEVAASAARDQDLASDAVVALNDQDAASALPRLDGAEQPRGAPADDDDVVSVRNLYDCAFSASAVKACSRLSAFISAALFLQQRTVNGRA